MHKFKSIGILILLLTSCCISNKHLEISGLVSNNEIITILNNRDTLLSFQAKCSTSPQTCFFSKQILLRSTESNISLRVTIDSLGIIIKDAVVHVTVNNQSPLITILERDSIQNQIKIFISDKSDSNYHKL